MNVETDPYARAARNWDSEMDIWKRQARFLSLIAMLGLAVGAVGVGFGVWAGVKSEYIPYLVAIDDLGRAEVLSSANFEGDVPEPVIKREIRTFIERARAIPADEEVLTRDLERLFTYVRNGSQVHSYLRRYYEAEDTNPYTRIQRQTVEVDATSVTYTGGQSWRIEWIETVRNRMTGEHLSEARMVAVVVLGDRAIVDPGSLNENPLGLIVEHIDIQEETR